MTVGEHLGQAEEVPGFAGLDTGEGHSAGIRSVSCASAGNCSAGGTYTDGSFEEQAFVVDEVGGSWGTAQEVPGIKNLPGTGTSAVVISASCPSAGNCSAGGTYFDASETIRPSSPIR